MSGQTSVPVAFYSRQLPLIKIHSIINTSTFSKPCLFNTSNNSTPLSYSTNAFTIYDYNSQYKRRNNHSIRFDIKTENTQSNRVQLCLFNTVKKVPLPPIVLYEITINSSKFTISKYFKKPHLMKGISNYTVFNNIDVTDYLIEGNNTLIMSTKEDLHDVICVVYSFECIDIDVLVNQFTSLHHPLQPTKPHETNEVEEVEQSISLKCPISYTRMKVPVKGKNCSHSTCFDLKNYFINSITKQAWNCPICSLPLLYNDLIVDSVLDNVLKNSNDNVSSIILSNEGTITEITEYDNDQEEEEEEEEEMYYKKDKLILSDDTKLMDNKVDSIKSNKYTIKPVTSSYASSSFVTSLKTISDHSLMSTSNVIALKHKGTMNDPIEL